MPELVLPVGSNVKGFLARVRELSAEADERMAREEPELWEQVKAARERRTQEILIPTPTGYELKPGVK